MAAHLSQPSHAFLYAVTIVCAGLSAFMVVCARSPKLRSKVRWGGHGRGYPMSEFGAWSCALYLMSFGSVFALSVTRARRLHICSFVFFGVCFVEMIYAALRDRAAHKRRRYADDHPRTNWWPPS